MKGNVPASGPPGVKRIAPDEFQALSRYIEELSGIYLDGSKTYLVETRLHGLMKDTGSHTFHELHRKVRGDPGGTLRERFIDAICTRETLFFRDQSPFELLRRRILPELIARKTGNPAAASPPRLAIWSAGCSTGQELYSIAMVLRECLPNPARFAIRLLGTDISDSALAGARAGEFSAFAVERGLPPELRDRYFRRSGETWGVREDIRRMCDFRKHNLMDSFMGLGRFDIVFCRNVAIYFQPAAKARLFDKLAGALEPTGYLLIGASESLAGVTDRFAPVTESNRIFYRKTG
jgi:chemotaxis protein methyltransferase CheR